MTIPNDLEMGYRKFRNERFAKEEQLYKNLAFGQKPRTMVIGCADSRVDPATIFAAAPGELFVVRNIAALVPPYEETSGYHGTSAAVEFAVCSLRVEKIIVLGHGLCGGVTAALQAAENRPVGQFIEPWVNLLAGIRDEMLEHCSDMDENSRQRALEQLAVRLSLDNLMTFPFVQNTVSEGTLALEGAWFSIGEARLEWLNGESEAFEAVDAR